MFFSGLFRAALLLVLSSSLTLAANKKKPEEYWAGTGLTTESLLRLKAIEEGNCYQNAQVLRACVAGLNAIASQAKPLLQWVPAELKADPAFSFGSERIAFGGLSLVEMDKEKKPAKESLRSWIARSEEKRKKTEAALERLYAASKDSQLQFRELFPYIVGVVGKDPKEDALVAALAMNAMSQVFDAHSHFDSVEQVNEQLRDADESFTGIGAQVQKLDDNVVIQSPIEGGPAEAAGVKANDVIQSIDGTSAADMEIGDVVKLLRGPEGTSVLITFLRQGVAVNIKIVRKKIELPNVSSKLLEDFGQKIGYIKIRNFLDNELCNKMRDEIKKYEGQEATGLVLDLRGNGGGLLREAVCMGSRLVGANRVIVKVRDLPEGGFTPLRLPEAQVTQLPIVVLIDAGSASASEVLSGALQDYQRAWILGERSFGKASVQSPEPVEGYPKIFYFQTTQRFYQPSGRTNQKVGIEPDFVVPAKLGATEDERFFLREGDIYPNALGADGPAWKQTRPEAVAKVESCVQKNRLAERKYQELAAAKEDSKADYQVLSAEEVLGCAAR